MLYGDQASITLEYTSSGGHANRWDTKFEGVINNLSRRYKETDSDYVRTEIETLHGGDPLPGLQRRAPEAGVARRHRRRAQHLADHAPVRRRGAGVGRAPARPEDAADQPRDDDRHADPEGDPRRG